MKIFKDFSQIFNHFLKFGLLLIVNNTKILKTTMKIDEKTNFEHYKALGQAIINQCLKNDIEELRKRVERLEQKDNWVRL